MKESSESLWKTHEKTRTDFYFFSLKEMYLLILVSSDFQKSPYISNQPNSEAVKLP